MLNTDFCAPDKNTPENTFTLFIFRVYKVLRGEGKNTKNTAYAALIRLLE